MFYTRPARRGMVLAACVTVWSSAAALAQNYSVIAVCHTDNKVVELDSASGRTLRSFTVPGEWFGETHEGAITADGRTMYVSTPYQKQVLVLDLTTFTQKGTITSPLFSRPAEVRSFVRIGKRESTSGDPHGLALNNAETKLYVTVEFAEVPGVVAVDLKTGRTTKIDTVVGGNYLAVQPRTDRLFLPTRENRVVVIDTKTDRIVKVIPVQGMPNGVSFTPQGEAWINGDRDGSVTVIDPSSLAVTKVIESKVQGPGRTAVSPDGKWAVAAHGPEITVFDAAAKTAAADFRFTSDKTGHGFPIFSVDGRKLHVLDELSERMVTFDLSTMRESGARAPVCGASFGGGIRVLK
jgi:YVTN family beta-propeller protein